MSQTAQAIDIHSTDSDDAITEAKAPRMPVNDFAGDPNITPGTTLGAYCYYVGTDPASATWFCVFNSNQEQFHHFKFRITVWGDGPIAKPFTDYEGIKLESNERLSNPKPNTLVLDSKIQWRADGVQFNLDPHVTTIRIQVLDLDSGSKQPMSTDMVFLGANCVNPTAIPFKTKFD